MIQKILLAIISIYAGNVMSQDKTIPWGKNKLDSKDYVLTFKRINKIANNKDTIQVIYINAKKDSVRTIIIDSNKKTIEKFSGELAGILYTTQRYLDSLITKEIVKKNFVLKFVDTTKIPKNLKGQEPSTPTDNSKIETVPSSKNGFVKHLEEYWIPYLALLILGGVIFYFSKTKSGKRKTKELLKNTTAGFEIPSKDEEEEKTTSSPNQSISSGKEEQTDVKKETLKKIAIKLNLEKSAYNDEGALVNAIIKKNKEELDTLKSTLNHEKNIAVANAKVQQEAKLKTLQEEKNAADLKVTEVAKDLITRTQEKANKQKEIDALTSQLNEKTNESLRKDNEMSAGNKLSKEMLDRFYSPMLKAIQNEDNPQKAATILLEYMTKMMLHSASHYSIQNNVHRGEDELNRKILLGESVTPAKKVTVFSAPSESNALAFALITLLKEHGITKLDDVLIRGVQFTDKV